MLNWLLVAPFLAFAPAIYICVRGAYSPEQVAALADLLDGGKGTLLSLYETGDPAWIQAPAAEKLFTRPLPRLRPWRRLSMVFGAVAFLSIALLLPQRLADERGNEILANGIASDLKNTVAELKKQDLITPVEEKKLQEEIERIRKDAMQRLDASSWEAADALREKTAAGISQKRDALKWAMESAARYSAAAQAGAPNTPAQAQELGEAIETLAKMGMLADAPPELQKLLGGQKALAGGKVQLPSDAASLKKLNESLARYLSERGERFGKAAQLGREFAQFDPREFPFSNEPQPDGDGDPGAGGINRGRGDASLTRGNETAAFDRFKAVSLPPGYVRSPDDWAPVAVLPGSPQESPVFSAPSQALQYANTAGQAAWRRTLAPRHYSAVRKYFEVSSTP
jgi:hypothetical protein